MRRLAVALVGALLLALTACAPSAALPDGVTVSVFQNRFDYGVRQLELKVSNATDAPITVTSATLESTRFATPAAWTRPQVIPAGAARDLKVQLTEPVCGEDPVDTVVIEFTLADGRAGSAQVTPSDETGRLDAINAEDCLGEAVAQLAVIAAADTVQWVPGAHQPATLDLTVRPTGAEGELTVRFVKGTVLLSLVDASGTPVYDLPLDLVISQDSRPSVIRLQLAPARCDPHAVAEDKRGTFFPLEVEVGPELGGRIYVPVSDGVRASLYDFVGDYCGLP